MGDYQKAADGGHPAGLDQLDWGEGKGAKLWECWKVEPCCGSPVNGKDAVMCCVHWYCCGICTASKLFSYSTNQPCAIVDHAGFIYCCQLCAGIAMRHNIRKKNGIAGALTGDAVLHCCCPYCSFCQMMRAVPREAWLLQPFPQVAVKNPECVILMQ